MEDFIPQSVLFFRPSHRWLTEECVRLVEQKSYAAGTEFYPEACRLCSAGLLRAHTEFIQRTRTKLRSIRRGSKRWWQLSNVVLSRIAKPSNSPLKRSDGSWAVSSIAKAELLASSFSSKWSMPDPVRNLFTDVSDTIVPSDGVGFFRIRLRCTRSVLSSLRADSGTGPDLLPARVLKMCARSLAVPVCLLARSILAHSRWPACWCDHWIYALYKRHAMSDPDNYRGLQLTPQLSKVVERLIASLFVPRLERIGAFGMHQFAYRQKRGARDALLHLVLSSLHAFSMGHRIVIYCSDVSGAFDCVDAERLCAKLRSFSVPEQLVDLLASWLRPRRARVVVGGQQSSPIDMRDMVYQGTVLGPVLWITFFSDSCIAVRAEGFDEIIFADDLSAWKAIPPHVSDEEALNLSANCQRSLHD